MTKKFKLYILGGVASVLVDIGLLALFHDIGGLNLYVSAIIAFVGSSIFGYLYHRNISFKDQDQKSHTTQFTQFILVNGSTQIVYMGLLYIGVDVLGVHYIATAIVAKGIIFIMNFILHKFVTFNKGSYGKYIIRLLMAIVMIGGICIYSKEITHYAQSLSPEYKELTGTTRYQIIPDKRANGDPQNDFITTPPDWNGLSGAVLEEYRKYKTSWTGDWYAMNTGEKLVYKELVDTLHVKPKSAFAAILRFRRYGGDFSGIRQHIPYLKKLGVGGVLLNPVRIANTPMRYDVLDYRHIDPRLSSIDHDKNFKDAFNLEWGRSLADKDFLQLVNDLHKAGLKVMIDASLGYSAGAGVLFEDIARKGSKSEYYQRFELFQKGDKDYDQKTCFLSDFFSGAEYPAAQKIRLDGRRGQCPLVYTRRGDALLSNPEREERDKKILDRRIKKQTIDGIEYDGVDGVRLDAADELPILLKQDLYKHIKQIKDDAVIIGETTRGNDYSAIEDRHFDGGMDYFLRTLSELFFIGKDHPFFPRVRLSDILQKYEHDKIKYQQLHLNNLGSHDTDRVYSKLIPGNRDLNYINGGLFPSSSINEIGSHIRDSEYVNKVELGSPYIDIKPSEDSFLLRKTLTMFEFMLPGQPSIYYGDEVGMRGADDPDNRKPMRRPEYAYQPQTVCIANKTVYCKETKDTETISTNINLLELYQKLIKFHDKNAALLKGDIDAHIDTNPKEENGILSFSRYLPNEKVYFISNQNTGYKPLDVTVHTFSPSSKRYNPLTETWQSTTSSGDITLHIQPEDSVILSSQE